MREMLHDRHSMVTGSFPDRASADRAFDAARRMGFREDEISVLMSEDTHRTHWDGGAVRGRTQIKETKAAEGAGVGGGIGAGLGALIVAALAAGAPLTIPGLVIAGPLAGALTGAGAGSVTGGIIGALIGAGIPEERARAYESNLQKGSIVLGVPARDAQHAETIEREWRELGGHDVHAGDMAHARGRL
jgi:hypothetical protein